MTTVPGDSSYRSGPHARWWPRGCKAVLLPPRRLDILVPRGPVVEVDDVRIRRRPSGVPERLPSAFHIGDRLFDGQEEVSLEAEEEAGVEEGRGVVPEEGASTTSGSTPTCHIWSPTSSKR